ncbi:MAG: tetratricopeptide repeat protein [Fuerstiella sp.]
MSLLTDYLRSHDWKQVDELPWGSPIWRGVVAGVVMKVREQTLQAKTRRYLYGAHLNLAMQAWQEGNLDRVVDLLNRHRPKQVEDDLRSADWYYLWNMARLHDAVPSYDMGGQISVVDVGPDAAFFACGTRAGVIQIWPCDSTDGPTALLNGHTDQITSLDISSDGTRLVSASLDRTVRVWSLATQQVINSFQNAAAIGGVKFSPDDTMIACTGMREGLTFWNLSTDEKEEIRTNKLVGFCSPVFSTDGKKLLLGSNGTNAAAVWDFKSKAFSKHLLHRGRNVKAVARSPDGRTVATASDSTIMLWSSQSWKQLAELKGHTDVVESIAFAPDSTVLVSGSRDRSVRLWDPVKARPISVLHGHREPVRSVACTSDAMAVVTGSLDGMVCLWDVSRFRNTTDLVGHRQGVYDVAISDSGDLLVSGGVDRIARLWNLRSRELVLEIPAQPDMIFSVAISPDERTIAIGCRDKSLFLIDISSGQPVRRTLTGHQSTVSDLAFTSDGSTLATAGADGLVKLWDVETAECVATLEGHRLPVETLAFSPDQKLLATAGYQIRDDERGEVILWDVASRKKRLVISDETLGDTYVVKFSSDGTKLMRAGAKPNEIELRDVETGKVIQTFRGHRSMIRTAALTPDGKTIVSGSTDRTVRFRDVQTGEVHISMPPLSDSMGSLAFASDGSLFAAGLNNGNVRLWEVATDDRRKTAEAESQRNSFASQFHLNFMIDAEPNNAQHLLTRGRLRRYSRTNLDQAIADLTRAVELDPSIGEAWALAGQIHYERRAYDLAVESLTRAIDNGSDDPATYASRGQSLSGLARWQEAIPDFTEAMQLMPRQWSYLKGRADARAETQEWARSLADFEALNKTHPGAGMLEQILIRLHLDNEEAARQLCDGFIERLANTDGTLAMEQLVMACVQLSQETDAIAPVIEMSQQLVKKVPTHHPFRYRTAQLLHRAGRHAESLAEMQKANELVAGESTVRGEFYTAMINHQRGET